MKKITKKMLSILLVIAMVLNHFMPIARVVALSYGEGDNFINMGIDNELGFTINSVTVNDDNWTSHLDEYHSNNNQYHIVISVSGNETTGDKVPRIQYGGNWNDYITSSTVHSENTYTFVLDLNDSAHQGFLGLSLEEEMNNPEPIEPNFDGKAYVVWSCGTGVCYHYFDNIPDFEDGKSTFYKDTDVEADNKPGTTFDVNAEYLGWYLADEFIEWQELYEIATGNKINWNTLEPEIILGEPNQNIQPLAEAAVDKCGENPSESCINLYAAEQGQIWTHKLRPVGEPNDKNAYVSYGDRNFKVVIYNSKFKGISMGDLTDLSYYPASWSNPFIMRDQFDISETSKNKPALLDSILLESTVIIRALNYNSFEIASIEALDVPNDAVEITKDKNGDFRLVFSSNFYDNVVFKVTDTNEGVSYIQVKRYTIDGWIGHENNRPVLIADFYFDKEKNYSDFDLTAKIVYKDGTTKNVSLTARYGIDDGMGNFTDAYEVNEETPEFGPAGKGLKKSTFVFDLEEGEDGNIKDIYLNAEYKGSTTTNYAGAYVGSGEGVLANIYHGEEE